MSNRQRIEVARVGDYWIRVDADAVTQERVLPGAFTLDGLHPEFVKTMGSYTVWSIDELSVGERRCVFETGAMILVEVDTSGAGLFAGTNPQAAEWAAKHGGEISGKFWPDIPETTRKRIGEIIKNGFEKKTPFSVLVAEIRTAGISSGEHTPRESDTLSLKTTDLRKPECPYCKKALKKIPGAKTKCSRCGQFMYVRTRPEDRARVVVTEAEAHRMEEDWKIKMMEGAHEPDDLAAMIANTEISSALVNANLEAWKATGQVSKIKWIAVGPELCLTCKENNGKVRTIREKFPSGDVIPPAHPGCFCILTTRWKNRQTSSGCDPANADSTKFQKLGLAA